MVGTWKEVGQRPATHTDPDHAWDPAHAEVPGLDTPGDQTTPRETGGT
jgi:hypothetical protein